MYVEHPQKTLRFWDGFAFRHTAPAILVHHFNLRTVFAVMSHTSVFRCDDRSKGPCKEL